MDAAEFKKHRSEMFAAPMGGMSRTPEEMKEAFEEAVKTHPFVDVGQHYAEVTDSAVFYDGENNIVGVLLRGAIPEHACQKAADILRTAATRTSLRASVFGGEAPLSGIAGYYDYSGSPIEFKCRKTSFTCEMINRWADVFPMVEYVSGIYKAACPIEWAKQSAAIPDVVRINNSPFSTLTINQRFRTAKHTDAGDFDEGYGMLAVLEGDFEGLHLGLTDFKVCFHMKPRDMLIFNTHHFHANTELEKFGANPDWSRLTCVFYYRAVLGESSCVQNYKRRLEVAKKLPIAQRPPNLVKEIVETDNGDNYNRPAEVFPVLVTPFRVLCGGLFLSDGVRSALVLMQSLCEAKDAAVYHWATVLFGEERFEALDDGLPLRTAEEKHPVLLQVTTPKASPLGGFSEASGAIDIAAKNHTVLNDDILSATIGEGELLKMWRDARALWLGLVLRDWDHMLEINPDRDDFSWKNKSDMNTAFFDLCEVAQQVMIQLLGKEEPSKVEQNAFWLYFAAHLFFACQKELKMPESAMSLKKLNVKLKDFNFGGTRYFKDMPKEEQERRIARKKRIEEARRRGVDVERDDSNWLENDSFDYQSEATVVAYAAQGWRTPEQHASDLKIPKISDVLLRTKTAAEKVSITVVVPASMEGGEAVECGPLNEVEKREWNRLMNNAAALRSMALHPSAPTNLQRSDQAIVIHPQVTLHFVTVGMLLNSEPRTPTSDMIVFRSSLCYVDDTVAQRAIVAAKKVAPLVLLAEPVLSCRSEFMIRTEVLNAYNKVAPAALQRMVSSWQPALPFTEAPPPKAPQHLRTKRNIHTIAQSAAHQCGTVVAAMFHFPMSPRNTSVWML